MRKESGVGFTPLLYAVGYRGDGIYRNQPGDTHDKY